MRGRVVGKTAVKRADRRAVLDRRSTEIVWRFDAPFSHLFRLRLFAPPSPVFSFRYYLSAVLRRA